MFRSGGRFHLAVTQLSLFLSLGLNWRCPLRIFISGRGPCHEIFSDRPRGQGVGRISSDSSHNPGESQLCTCPLQAIPSTGPQADLRINVARTCPVRSDVLGHQTDPPRADPWSDIRPCLRDPLECY